MDKEEILEMAHKYSKNERDQRSYMAGFQAACNVVRCKINTCDNLDFCDEMEELAEVAYMDLDSDD